MHESHRVQPEDEARCALLRILGRLRGSLHWFRAPGLSCADQLSGVTSPLQRALQADKGNHAIFRSRSAAASTVVHTMGRALFPPCCAVRTPRTLRPGIVTAPDDAMIMNAEAEELAVSRTNIECLPDSNLENIAGSLLSADPASFAALRLVSHAWKRAADHATRLLTCRVHAESLAEELPTVAKALRSYSMAREMRPGTHRAHRNLEHVRPHHPGHDHMPPMGVAGHARDLDAHGESLAAASAPYSIIV